MKEYLYRTKNGELQTATIEEVLASSFTTPTFLDQMPGYIPAPPKERSAPVPGWDVAAVAQEVQNGTAGPLQADRHLRFLVSDLDYKDTHAQLKKFPSRITQHIRYASQAVRLDFELVDPNIQATLSFTWDGARDIVQLAKANYMTDGLYALKATGREIGDRHIFDGGIINMTSVQRAASHMEMLADALRKGEATRCVLK